MSGVTAVSICERVFWSIGVCEACSYSCMNRYTSSGLAVSFIASTARIPRLRFGGGSCASLTEGENLRK
ncbi:hypothetical protein GS532_22580 [Rhodococcus hoagii]|nr:hypothetical protein [Prescottella equi]